MHKYVFFFTFKSNDFRFTLTADKDWYNESIENLISERLGVSYCEMAKVTPVFVDFMRYTI